eukprot:322143-Chlamydomonas_euryale.AAC.1
MQAKLSPSLPLRWQPSSPLPSPKAAQAQPTCRACARAKLFPVSTPPLAAAGGSQPSPRPSPKAAQGTHLQGVHDGHIASGGGGGACASWQGRGLLAKQHTRARLDTSVSMC